MANINHWIFAILCSLFLVGCNGDGPAAENSTLSTSNKAATVFAGSKQYGSVDSSGVAASFNSPVNLAVDTMGSLYVADAGNNKIRKVAASGVVTTVAGSGQPGSTDGAGMGATFDHPSGVAVDAGGALYVADTASNKIRKISPAGLVTTLAGSGQSGSTDGLGGNASFNHPTGIAVDGAGSLYVADTENNLIRKITATGLVTTLAGSGQRGSTDGLSGNALFNHPMGIVVDGAGSIYVADTENSLIRKITAAGLVTTLVGSGHTGSADGLGRNASFNHPMGIAADAADILYVADTESNLIRRITAAGLVTTLTESGQSGSTDGLGANASFNHPMGIAINSSGIAYITESDENIIYSVNLGRGRAKINSKRFNSFQIDCQQVKQSCIAQCSETALPTPDYGFAFWNCMTSCMDEKGFLYGVDC
ncbi:hypothetical protein LGM89_24320 [Burkholderia sp. AU31624]|uniref:NHL repeat-containing protein n=1 Tax=unclassified Burkholderia TaxID=2613784 RepID=UPI000B7A3473|nr:MULTISPECIES: NHL repeat-containing protein [unclassified Burkholderia]MCA8256399.1 hypothetical protein [Burkholderia sp. AU31624]OXI15287.1 hypothetical protein CFB43_32660 [Burkholderia sp. AU15512]